MSQVLLRLAGRRGNRRGGLKKGRKNIKMRAEYLNIGGAWSRSHALKQLAPLNRL